jgi:ABC-type transporter Mla subunit MlaD
MPRERNAFKLGLMMIVSAALAFGALIFVGSRSFEDRTPIVVRLAHEDGVPMIKAGVPIICGPQVVGTVTSVTMTEADAPHDPSIHDYLYFEIRGEVNRSLELRRDCTIAVEGALLGGQGQLRIENRGTSPVLLTAATPILAKTTGFAATLSMLSEQLDVNQRGSLISQIKMQLDPSLPLSIIAKVHKSADDINAITENIKRTVDPTRETAIVAKLSKILDHVNALTASLSAEFASGNNDVLLGKLNRSLDLLEKALSDVAGVIHASGPDIQSTIGHVKHISRGLDEQIIPTVVAEMDRSNTKSILAKFHAAADRVNTSLGDLNVVSGDIRKIVTFSKRDIQTLIANATQASAHLNGALKDLRRNPWRLLHKAEVTEVKQALVFDAVREFSEASARLDKSVADLGVLLETSETPIPANDPTLTEIRQRIKATLEHFDATERALWEQLDAP